MSYSWNSATCEKLAALASERKGLSGRGREEGGGRDTVGPATCLTPSFLPPGLAKPIGLVEGPGGLGQGGMAATLRDDSQETEGKFEEYGYNAQLSDRISLDRTIPDYRPKK